MQFSNIYKKFQLVNYPKSIDLTSRTLIDDNNFKKILQSGFFGDNSLLAKNMNQNGFCLLEIKDSNWLNLLDTIKFKLEKKIDKEKLKSGNFSLTRWQDAWDKENIDEIRELANHPEILSFLKKIFGREFFPFQTLNFPNGSAQHVHSDAVHFNTLPKGFMCGVWIAMEDVHEDAGPLFYYPKSHKLPFIDGKTLDISYEDIVNSKYPQKLFEPYWIQIIKEENFQKEIFLAKKGQVLIWHSNIFHGGSLIKNRKLTRWSQVTHYFGEGCIYTSPLFITKDSPLDSPSLRTVRKILV